MAPSSQAPILLLCKKKAGMSEAGISGNPGLVMEWLGKNLGAKIWKAHKK